MSGSPKYSSVAYSAARRQAAERERLERERRAREQLEESRRSAEATAREHARRSAGLLAEIDTETAYIRSGLAFMPAGTTNLHEALSTIEEVRSLHTQGRFAEAEAAASGIRSSLSAVRELVEHGAQQLALRLATIEALSNGLRSRGYEVAEPLAQSDGTMALRAVFAGQAGIDLAIVPGDPGDEIVWQRHDADTPDSARASCPTTVELHGDLQSELHDVGIDLGGLWWSEQDEDAKSGVPAQRRHEADRR